MICNKCNHKLPDDSEFCQYCGKKIDPEENNSLSSSEIVIEDVLIQETETQEKDKKEKNKQIKNCIPLVLYCTSIVTLFNLLYISEYIFILYGIYECR